jgi:hypothetical protein
MSIYLRSYITYLARVMGSEELPEAALEYIESVLPFPMDELLQDRDKEVSFIEALRSAEDKLKNLAPQQKQDEINAIFLNAANEAHSRSVHV